MKLHFLFLLTAVLSLAACSKADHNGDLGGMWQLVSRTTKADGTTVDTRTTRIFYCFSRELLFLEQLDGSQNYLSYFTRTADSLFVGTTYATPQDVVVGYDALAPFGVTANGRFRFDALTADRLVLSNEQYVLSFRKY